MNRNYEAITYGWRNIENGKMYIGYHKTSDIDDGYIFSSEFEEVKNAWEWGKLRRSILYVGTQSVAITLENFLLKNVNANTNDLFYNRSVGGGEGCVKDFSNLTEEVKKIGLDWIKGIEPKVKKIKSKVDKPLMKRIVRNIKNGKYKVHEKESVTEISNLPRNQVRLKVHENTHLESIIEKMKSDPAKARENVSPVIVIIYLDGSKQIIDGNHTIDAAVSAGWNKIPVIYFNSSEFDDEQSNINYFGYLMNHQEKLKKPNTIDDLKKAIMDFVETHSELDIGSETFKEAFKDAYGEFWSGSEISSNITATKKLIETNKEILKNNFKVYTETELKKVVQDYEISYPNHAVISISSGSCYNAGIGAVLNKAGGMDTWNGIMIVSHRNLDEYRRYDEPAGSKYKLEQAMKRMHPNMKCKVVVLSPYPNSQNA